MPLLRRKFQPFAARARGTIVAVVLTFALVAALSATLSIWTTSRSKNRAVVVEVAGRQRTLAERYVNQVLLARSGTPAAQAHTGMLLAQTAHVLLDGGTAPAVEGDDDETTLPATADPVVRAQLEQEQRLITDLTATGAALLAHKPVGAVPLTAGERIQVSDPVQRLRVLAALTSNVSLNTARTIAQGTDRNISNLITIQIALGIGGLAISLLLAWALVAATRRQTAHFRSLVTSSTDLVLVFDGEGCRYASQSVTAMLARP